MVWLVPNIKLERVLELILSLKTPSPLQVLLLLEFFIPEHFLSLPLELLPLFLLLLLQPFLLLSVLINMVRVLEIPLIVDHSNVLSVEFGNDLLSRDVLFYFVF